jgi:3(or 17)beta-hydroxysteroid dehydrogenase
MASSRLAGRVAIITGGASGIGAATVRRFRAEGAEVVLSDVQDDLGKQVAAESGAIFQHHDVTDEASWRCVMALTEKRFGRLDIMFNNAGILGNGKSIGDIDMATWNHVNAVNQTGVMLGCQNAINSYTGVADDVAYCTTKGAVLILTKSVAVWCARQRLNIRCNSIHPGSIHTPILDSILDAAPDREAVLHAFNNMSPMGRMGRPEEVAALVLFLATDEASFITAGEYLVDGGSIAPPPGF